MRLVTIFMIVLNRLVYFQGHETFYTKFSIGDAATKTVELLKTGHFS